MAEAIHRPALDEIEIALAGGVPQPGALAADEHLFWAGGDVHHRIERMSRVGHVGLLLEAFDEKVDRNAEKAATFSVAAFSKA
jgi:hypothetical protein